MSPEALERAEQEVLETVKQQGSLEPGALIAYLASSHGLSDAVARAAIWDLIDQDRLLLTQDYTLEAGTAHRDALTT